MFIDPPSHGKLHLKMQTKGAQRDFCFNGRGLRLVRHVTSFPQPMAVMRGL